MIQQKLVSGNSYYLTAKGIKALRTLINTVRSPELRLDRRPIGTKLSSYILARIIKQYSGDKDQEAVSIRSLTAFFNYYYDKLSTDQQQEFIKNNCEARPILCGNYSPAYLTTQRPYPKSVSVNRTISPQQVADLMWELDYSKPNQEQKFKDTIDRSNSMAIAFSLAACDPNLQNWLVCRLVRSLKHRNWLEIDLTYEKSEFSEWGLRSIWQQIAEQIEDFTEPRDFTKYIDQRFMVIKVKKTQLPQQEILIKDFWHPLLEQLSSSSGERKKDLRLLLFIVNDCEIKLDASYKVCQLEPILSINSDDVITWSKTPKVSDYLEKDKGKRKFNDWKRCKVPSLDYNLPKLFKTLLAYIDPEADLDIVAQCWKIGGF